MGKKPQAQEGSQSGIVAALSGGNKAMKVAYDAEYDQRLQLVRENEAMERETLVVEVAIKGLTDQGRDLRETVGALTERHDGLKEKVDALTKERDGLAEENTQLADLRKQLDEEVTRLQRLQQDYVNAVGKFREARRKIAGD